MKKQSAALLGLFGPLAIALPSEFWLPPKPAIIGRATQADKLAIEKGTFPFPPMTGANLAPPGPFALTAQALLTDTTVDSSHTFASVGIGTPYSDRYVVVEIGYANGSGVTLNSVTIGSVSATLGVQSTGSSVTNNSAIYYAKVTSGTTANITLNFSGTVIRKMMKVWTFSGFSGSSPAATSGVTGNTALSLASSQSAVVFEIWSAPLTANTSWLQGPYPIGISTNLGSGSTPLSGNFGQRAYPGAATINGSVVASSASNALAGMVWNTPSMLEGICDAYDQFSDPTDQIIVTTGSLAIGTSTAGRMVVVAFGWMAAASRTITSVTIGGVLATVSASNATASGGAAIYRATGVTGTTAVVVITFSSTVTRCSGTIFRTTPASSTEVGTGNAGASATNITAANVACSMGGFAIMIGREGSTASTVTATWSGIDLLALDHAIATEAAMQTRAGYVLTTETQSTNGFTFTSGTANTKNLAAAAWL